ncbi:MAG: glycosyltransferase [Candidatus Eisenbacteria bacterium]|nr:glycosyltransferase [Candidatus Eisenbacteria bacterium]
MRVMHVIEAMHQGGAESLVIEHVRHAGPDVESRVCALNRGGAALDQAAALGARVEVLRRRSGALERAAGIARLASRLSEARIEVVNGHNPTGSLYGTIAAAIARVPVVVRTEHSIHYAGRHSAFYAGLERWTTRRSAAVVCVCEAVRDSHARRFPGIEDRFVTVMNGIGPAAPSRSRADVRRELGVSESGLLVLAVGSLTPQKAQHLLIDAIAEVEREQPAVRVAIAGDGVLRGALEQRIRAAALSGAVTLLGPRADVGDLMQAADLFALTSEREGLSVTLLEAMRAGLPAVATRVGGNGEAVADGESGLLVAPGDAGALARAIGGLLSDPERRTAMGREATARWAARFTATRMVAETEALYRRALEPGARAGAARAAGGRT